MIKVYTRALRTFAASFLLFFGLSVIVALLEQLFDSSSINGASLFVYAFVALSCHRLLLTGERTTKADLFSRRKDGPLAGRQWPFMWRLGVFWLVTACFWGFFTYLIYGLVAEPGKETVAVAVMLALAPAVLVFYVIVALVGTVLPAAAMESDMSVATAFKRGKKSFWVTLWRLISGNGLFAVLSLAALFFLVSAFEETADPLIDFLLAILGEISGMFMIMLTAAALCLAYETSAPVPEAAEV